MDAAIKKEFILQGLCCANCASKIERDIGKLPGVSAASVDFVNETLSIEIAQEEFVEGVLEQAGSIIKRHDSDTVVREKAPRVPGQKVIFLSGLCCADCAQKIEDGVRRMDGVHAASMDFVTGRLTIEADDRRELPGIIRQAAEIARRVEPDAEIAYSEAKPDEIASDGKKERVYRALLVAGAVFYGIAILVKEPFWLNFSLFLTSYLLVGGEVLLRSVRNISKGQIFDENFLMSVATIGAFAIGEFAEGVAVMLFYQVGELFQRLAVSRSRKSIASLMDIRPDYANLIDGGQVRRVAPEEVGVGDRILVRPGEKVPIDGTVADGCSSLDTSALTGESLPRDVEPGSTVLSGSINQSGALTIEVSREYSDSTIAKILDLVQNASSKKAVTENFITKFARVYTPAVVFAALALAIIPPLVLHGPFTGWIGRALVFLVVSCPCALVISIPLSFFGGIGGASKNGILIKGSNYLEALYNVDTFVFDKTGTLTKGVFQVSKIESAGAVSRETLLDVAAHAEADSNHPIALSIRQAYGREIDRKRIAEAAEIPGQGIRVTIDGKTVLAGNRKLMDAEGISCSEPREPGTVAHIAIDGVYAGYILIADEIKEDSRRAAEQLRAAGVKRLVMLTGDSKSVGEQVAEEVGLDEAYADLLPQQKVEKLEEIKRGKASGKKLAFVGDGINDAPVLAMADIGIAMGGMGSDAAIEAADVVLMTDEPSKLPEAIQIARKTHRIVWENIIFALGVKAVILVLGALGIATMWAAVFGDVGVAVIAILNATRALRIPRKAVSGPVTKQNGYKTI
ncbi:cadmium-translocating P-type ATPase [Caproiciproducens sp. NJN-50]|uniref:heavy metal translocating P-type ATPase n=1 Tax=Acutalibacteraceae TaxID=3082771 RepID=UPI000FFE052E|nr:MULTISPECIES: heavy metal translocating P-type ATPase [Acutalibacteraceae]QAT48737.1 cadmium-translocating P-type ATPase [Caproiciproducens sp. NJN-50]